MANSSARRPPPSDLPRHVLVATQHLSHQANHQHHHYLSANNHGGPIIGLAGGAPAAPSKGNAASSVVATAELVKPHYYAKGHQRRQSVARLLPDISKLRLLSWLVEASNELINCDIAIMDGVYAKLNRSRESLLFWQQSQQQQQASPVCVVVPSSRASVAAADLAPVPPSVQPIGNNKTVISKRHKQRLARNSASSSSATIAEAANQQQQQQQQRLVLARNKLFKQKLFSNTAPPAASGNRSKAPTASSRNHHSLPLTNCDSTSLAAISMRSSLSNNNDNDSIAGSINSQPAARSTQSACDSFEAAVELMMRQNAQRKQQQRAALKAAAATGAGELQTTRGRRSNDGSLPSRLQRALSPEIGFGDVGVVNSDDDQDEDEDDGDDEQEEDDDEEDDEDDDDSNSSTASSTTSSGIHGTSSSSSAVSSSSSSASSIGSNCSFGRATTNRASTTTQTTAKAAYANATNPLATTPTTTTATSTAEQLSERIRRAVMEHNYLQNLLVNVIRHHDRQLERHEQELVALRRQQPAKLDVFGRPAPASLDGELPRIDLAGIAEALDDGCQCSCHHHRHEVSIRYDRLSAMPPPRPPPPSTISLRSNRNNKLANNNSDTKASTLPTSSSLSLFQTASLVPSRKNRRKKNGNEPPSREDLIQKLSDRLCENCFETHYWLQSCMTIQAPNDLFARDQLQQQQQQQQIPTTIDEANDLNNADVAAAPSDTHDQQAINAATTGLDKPQISSTDSPAKSNGGGRGGSSNCDLDSIIALRNATFIKLVQQQVRATISNSIELIDLIRREIKSPESIKQRQLMRCFSASIQLLSSVANYVVPSQDISTFIPTDVVVSGGGTSGQGNKFGNVANGHQQQQHQATTLFNLPPSDFDHLLLYPHQSRGGQQHSANAGVCDSFLANHHRHSYQSSQQQQPNNYHLAQAPEIPIRRRHQSQRAPTQRRSLDESRSSDALQMHPRVHLLSRDEQQQSFVDRGSFRSLPPDVIASLSIAAKSDCTNSTGQHKQLSKDSLTVPNLTNITTTTTNPNGDSAESSSGASSNNSSASSSIARGQVQQSSLKTKATSSVILDGKASSLDLTSKFSIDSNFSPSHNGVNNHQHHLHHNTPTRDNDDLAIFQSPGRAKFWQSSKFNFIKKLLQVKQQRLLRQQSKDRRIYNHKVANKFRLVMMDLIHFNKSQQLLATENGVNSLLTSMRNVLEFGLYLTVKLY